MAVSRKANGKKIPRQSKVKTSVRTPKASKEALVRWRFFAVCAFFFALFVGLVMRLAQVQALPSQEQGYEFLQNQGNARILRSEIIDAHRGVITDRNGEPLAVSTPVVTVAANPKELQLVPEAWQGLAQALEISKDELAKKIQKYSGQEFIYLKRHLTPKQADTIADLKVPGVFTRQEYGRFYPAGEVAAHVVGMTNIDDEGQEGIELAYNEWLKGSEGEKEIKKDLMGRVVEEVRLVRSAQPGNDLALSLDMRVQYVAYRALKNAVTKHSAVSGSVVVLDARTGEVLAMANQPSYNPNNRQSLSSSEQLKNRAITDQFEPGSTMKPLTAIAALETGDFTPRSKFNTSPGRFRLKGKTVFDPVNYGEIDLTRIITKSSQVGISKLALQMEEHTVLNMFYRLGIGESVGTGFPGEASGTLPSLGSQRKHWSEVERATHAYGYGLTTTTLQLARAYSVLANEGVKNPISLLKLSEEDLASLEVEQVTDGKNGREVLKMLETVLGSEGTGKEAALQSYTAGGKTGTVHKASKGGYGVEEKVSVFAGVAPISDPRIVIAIMVNEPRSGIYSGGKVSAPIFSQVAESTLRILQQAPDKVSSVSADAAKSKKLVGEEMGNQKSVLTLSQKQQATKNEYGKQEPLS